MPDLDAGALPDTDAVQTLRQNEQAIEHLRERKVRAQRLLRNFEAALLEPIAVVGDVPGVQLAAGKLFQAEEFLAARGPAAPRQIIEKRQHLLAALGHAGRQSVVGEIRESQQFRELVAQRQYLRDDGIVVEAPRARAQV